jgi:hypothetical protein
VFYEWRFVDMSASKRYIYHPRATQETYFPH